MFLGLFSCKKSQFGVRLVSVAIKNDKIFTSYRSFFIILGKTPRLKARCILLK
jgi:hypothetical protein